jgi:hypothetical protein
LQKAARRRNHVLDKEHRAVDAQALILYLC